DAAPHPKATKRSARRAPRKKTAVPAPDSGIFSFALDRVKPKPPARPKACRITVERGGPMRQVSFTADGTRVLWLSYSSDSWLRPADTCPGGGGPAPGAGPGGGG